MAEKDIISKQLIKHITSDVAIYLLGLPIQQEQIELLETEHQRIEQRRADVIAHISGMEEHPDGFILHIEIQNDNSTKMAARMLRYNSDIRLCWPDTPIRQYVIYIGSKRLTMKNGIEEHNHSYHYTIIDMHEINCNDLIQLDNPDALVLAILCDFDGKPEQDVVHYIIKRLDELLRHRPETFREYMGMVEVLSGNRNLKEKIREAEKMLSQVKLEDLPSYEIGMEQGLEQGLEQKERDIVLESYRAGINTKMIARITQLDEQRVKAILEEENLH